ncbi:ATP-binding cassette domain-containing protein [Seonamhaeicola marinus]|uniref:ATP-binding cassette domain-containing protein n=1 Tax=Seonamhaeicola marinus TaxID=1912246 RepID=A0A5D0J6W0_9FLAO|nr:ATP-binding cassette domain-containing protein [Seonamhaeicola marinus]TYA92095.1 ATP-binding cassette domain-containing protein [Seonamhaeicola marinus]
MILEADSIELYFKNKAILNGVYLKGETGKITGILGRNGSGKSCLLRIIFGDLKPKYKLIRLDSKPILKALFTTKKVHYLPQYNFISKSLRLKTVFQLFEVNWFDFIIEFESFSIYRSTKFGDLSGGERRIVEIYLILKAPGQIILLDEPFNGVAPIHIEKIKDLINREKNQKIIILTDHRYSEVIDVCDNLYLIRNGCTKLVDNLKELEDYNYLSMGTL